MYTYHSIVRANERTRYNGRSAERFIENGIARGKTADAFKQDECDYLTNVPYDNCTAKAYDGFCFIISEDSRCITLYPLPEWFGKKRFYSGKKRIRNMKRYTLSKSNKEYASC